VADRISAYKVNCIGGLNTNRDLLFQAESAPGSAIELVNYEPSLAGGYRRLSGFSNDYGTVAGTGSVLGVCVAEGLNDNIFACRKPSSGTAYFYRWIALTSTWVAITTPGTVTMDGVNKVRFAKFNWGSRKIALADGVNPAATYDGSTYTQITHANAPDAPKFIDVFKNHLFLAGDATDPYNLYFSSPFNPTDFNPANGSGVINVGFDIVQIKQFRDSLYVFGINQIKVLRGTSLADFVLEEVTTNLGCVAPDSVVELAGNLIFLSADGFRPIAGTERLNDIELQNISKSIQSRISILLGEIVSSNINPESLSAVVVRNKTQFRFFIPDENTFGILGGIRQNPGGGFSFEFSQLYGFAVACADSDFVGAEEFVIHGGTDGKVHRQEKGTSFDTDPILSIYQTPYYYFEDPTVRKNFYSISTFLRSEGASTIVFSVSYDFDDSINVFNPNNYNITTGGAAAFYNEAIYDATAVYDGNPSPVVKTNISGSGFSVAYRYVTNDTNASHTVQGFVLNFAYNDRR
jgi:hypothetical protein